MSEGNKKILLVDDDLVLLGMYKARLEAEGYEVVTAGNGEEAINIAKEILPVAILMDIMMPKINGFDALCVLKSKPETKNIPVLILTALTQENHKQKGIGDGASDYIIKSETMPKDVIIKLDAIINSNGNSTVTVPPQVV